MSRYWEGTPESMESGRCAPALAPSPSHGHPSILSESAVPQSDGELH